MDLHEIKLLLQRQFSDGLVTIVGSGLSCAEGLPSITDLANHLQTTIRASLNATDASHWARLAPLVVANGLEAALLELAPTPTLEAVIVKHTADFIAAREQQVIGDIFAKTKTLSFTRLLSHLLKPEAGVSVVTTNYDRLIEIASEEAGLGVDTMFVGQFAGRLDEQESQLSFCRAVEVRRSRMHLRYRPRVKIFKPHGSLDWYHREGRPVRHSGDLALPRLIITPGLNKFRNGYESPFDRHRERANLEIDRASRFLIIGYGFNDDHLETHLTPRIRSGVPTLLLAYSLRQNAMKLVRECPNVVAIQHADIEGQNGCTVFIEREEVKIPGLSLWDLNTFVSEVLEP